MAPKFFKRLWGNNNYYYCPIEMYTWWHPQGCSNLNGDICMYSSQVASWDEYIQMSQVTQVKAYNGMSLQQQGYLLLRNLQ